MKLPDGYVNPYAPQKPPAAAKSGEFKDGRPLCDNCGKYVSAKGFCCLDREERAIRACAGLADPERDVAELVAALREIARPHSLVLEAWNLQQIARKALERAGLQEKDGK